MTQPIMKQHLSLEEKVSVFRNLFKGREDVFARRWHSRTSGKSGYQPVCRNEWDRQLCDKKKYKCAECPNRLFKPLEYEDIYRHLEGKTLEGQDVIGVYAILAEGAYLYDAKAHTLTRVAEGDLRKLSGAQEFVFSAPLNLVYVADLSVYDGREIPAERARYLCGQDAAGYAENVNLYTAGHGLRSITRGSAPEAELLAALGVDADRCFLALVQTVGR